MHLRLGTIRALLVAFVACCGSAWCFAAQPPAPRYELHFPTTLPGLQTLACDLHMHTMFSDGNVWPTVRVNEAWRLGLDALAITDHIEYQPHKDDVPTNFARSFVLAEGSAKAANLLLIKAAEITRDTPPGHFNALFLNDIQPLNTPEFVDAIGQANAQGAFVFWNHQGWKGEEKGKWLEVHTTLLDKKWFHGMEVANGDEYYPSAHACCLEKNLTMMGNSDIHDPDLRPRSTAQDHRTMTLVLAKARTAAALKEALMEGRTIVWYKDQLIGRETYLRGLFNASVEVGPVTARSKTSRTVLVRNRSSADIKLLQAGAVGPKEIVLPAESLCQIKLTVPEGAKPVTLSYTAANFIMAPGKGLPVTLQVEAK